MVSLVFEAMIKLHTQFSFFTFLGCLALFTSTRGRIFLVVVVTSIGGLQDVLWVARWDRGAVIRLIVNLLNLNGGASFCIDRFLCRCGGFSWWCCGVNIIITPISGLQDVL
jgi:hypothetical protein